MGTSLEVYPSLHAVPTLRQLLEDSTRKLHAFLDRVGILDEPQIEFQLRRRHDHVEVSHSDEVRWTEAQYGWFQLQNLSGGTDAGFEDVEQSEEARIGRDLFCGEYLQKDLAYPITDRIKKTLSVGHYWTFRSRAGNSDSARVTRGMLAASLAELTDGCLHSYGGACDERRLPALPSDFLKWFMIPEMQLDEGWRVSCVRRIASFKSQLSLASPLGYTVPELYRRSGNDFSTSQPD